MMQDLRRRYEELYGYEPSPPNAVTELGTRLGVQLPDDFKNIATFFSGGYLGGKSLHAISGGDNATNIYDETERLRVAIGLPQNMIVLAEPASSLIVMECEKGSGKVIWIDATEAPNLAYKSNLRSPEMWQSYAAFFGELLDEEESERS